MKASKFAGAETEFGSGLGKPLLRVSTDLVVPNVWRVADVKRSSLNLLNIERAVLDDSCFKSVGKIQHGGIRAENEDCEGVNIAGDQTGLRKDLRCRNRKATGPTTSIHNSCGLSL
jgi:hypothetical protein